MKITRNPRRPIRSHKNPVQDFGEMASNRYNEMAGADKVMIVQPDIEKATIADDDVGAGRYIKVAATGVYNLSCINKAHSKTRRYLVGDIAVNAGSVYMCNTDGTIGDFDTTKWEKKALSVISSIPCNAGDIISTGMWHNSISVAGFLVADDTAISWTSQRR